MKTFGFDFHVQLGQVATQVSVVAKGNTQEEALQDALVKVQAFINIVPVNVQEVR